MSRALAHIEQCAWKQPIEGRDRIELIGVLGWQVIVKKDEFQVGDPLVYVEIDSLLQEREEFEFLRSKKFRIKTMKMAGVLSQGICFPLSVIPGVTDGTLTRELKPGTDVTDLLGIVKYEEEPLPPQPVRVPVKKKNDSWLKRLMFRIPCLRPLAKKWFVTPEDKRVWPWFIQKTDEVRIQNIPDIVNDKTTRWEVTEKIDGQSGTFYVVKHHRRFRKPKLEFGVCSRNYRLPEPDASSYWSVAVKYRLQEVLEKLLATRYPDADWICIQGECIGPGIQRNKYCLDTYDLYCFNLIVGKFLYGGAPDMQETTRFNVDGDTMRSLLYAEGLKCVPVVAMNYTLPDTVEEVLEAATAMSNLRYTLREGLVFRAYKDGSKRSFKAVSNQFLLKWSE